MADLNYHSYISGKNDIQKYKLKFFPIWYILLKSIETSGF